MESRKSVGIFALSACASLVFGTGAGGGFTRLAKHVPQRQISVATHLGRFDAGESLQLTIALKLKDQAGLNRFLARISDPHDSLYHQFIRTEQFADRFSPSQEEVDQVVQYFEKRGLQVVDVDADRLFIKVRGLSADVENALQVELHQYQTQDGRIVRAPTSDPMIADEIAPKIQGVVGLSTFGHWHKHLRQALRPGVTGSGPSGGLAPSDIKTAYSLSSLTQNGSGQTIALFELDGFKSSDITFYAQHFNLSSFSISNVSTVLIDGATGSAGSGGNEVTLDLEMLVALAPAATIKVYEGPNTDAGVIDTYLAIKNDSSVASISTSWGEAEEDVDSSTLSSENTIFSEMATNKQSIFAAAGDEGAYDNGSTLSVDDPGSQPYMVSVGGTTLTQGSGHSYSSESSWDTTSLPNPEGGGGGVSQNWSLPTWQQGVASLSNYGSTLHRMVPDVSLNANPDSGYSVYYSDPTYGTGWYVYGGTSAAAPLWAAFAALVNESRASSALQPLGFWNPTLYQIGGSSLGSTAFHDVSDGSTNLYYPAVSGYDLASGWGSMNGSTLFSLMTGGTTPPPAAPLSLSAAPGGSSTIVLSWNSSSSATSYTIYRSSSQSATFTALATGVTSTSYTDSGLSSGSAYYYYVEAVSGAGSSGKSSTVSASPTQAGPAAPGGLAVVKS